MAIILNTSFPVRYEHSIDELVDVAKDWIVSSPHNGFGNEALTNLGNNSFNTKSADNLIESLRYADAVSDSWGFKYSILNGTDSWVTELVGVKDQSNFKVSLGLYFETNAHGRKQNYAKPPIILSKIVDTLGGEKDGRIFDVSNRPLYLNEYDIDIAEKIMKGGQGNNLPILYVSRNSNNLIFVNEVYLADKLSGLAHVVVEPSKHFSHSLSFRVDYKNAYNGAIGVYWPNGYYKRILGSAMLEMRQRKELPENVLFQLIREQGLQVMTPKRLTYKGIEDMIKSSNFEKLLRQKDLDLETLLSETLKEMERIKAENDGLAEENYKLSESLSRRGAMMKLQAEKNHEGQKIIVEPKLPKLYPDEIKDLVVEALEAYQRSNCVAETRRMDLIKGILDLNVKSQNKEEILEVIKGILKSTKPSSPSFSTQFAGIGFEVVDSSGHPKIQLVGYDRRMVTISKTPSDHRAADTIITTIKRNLL